VDFRLQVGNSAGFAAPETADRWNFSDPFDCFERIRQCREDARAAQEEPMRKLLISGVLFLAMLIWTWFNYVGS
jgi:hypothetical protein